MVRSYKKKKQDVKVSEMAMKEAVELVLAGEYLRQVAKSSNVPRTTLRRYVNEAKVKGSNMSYSKSTSSCALFTAEQERMLEDYLKLAAKQNHGLSKKMTRGFAWEYAKKVGATYPKSWDYEQCAGEDWISGFMKHTDLSLRKPEPTSLSRGTAFNRVNVNQFF